MPGCGESDQLNSYSFGTISEMLKKFILKKKLQKVVLVGHSLGGDFAIQILEQLDEIKGVFLIGTSPAKKPLQPQEMFLPNLAAAILFKESLTNVEIDSLANSIAFNKKSISTALKKTHGIFRAGVGESIGEGDYEDEFEILKSTKKPFALVFGENDILVNRTFLESQQFENLYGNKVYVIRNSSHSPQIDSPEEINSLLEEFVGSIKNY